MFVSSARSIRSCLTLVHRWLGGRLRLRLREPADAPKAGAWFSKGVARFVADAPIPGPVMSSSPCPCGYCSGRGTCERCGLILSSIPRVCAATTARAMARIGGSSSPKTRFPTEVQSEG